MDSTKCNNAIASTATAGKFISINSAGRRPTRKRGANMRRSFITLAALVAVFAFYSIIAGSASASSKHGNRSQGSTWTVLGGDPLFKGGLYGISKRKHISLRQAYVWAVTSRRGQTAMALAGLNAVARKAIAHSARTGHFRKCPLKYGSFHLRMAFGTNGIAVDRDVTFRDKKYKNHPAPAFCDHVMVSHKKTIHRGKEVLVKTVENDDGSTDYYYDRVDSVSTKTCYVDSLVPLACGNFAIERLGCASSVRLVHHRRHVHVPPPPKPSYACTNLSLSATTVQVGVPVTATVTYMVANGAVFQSVDYDWGDGTPTTNGGTSKNHAYSTANAFTVTATVNFVLPNGSHVSATADACSKPLTVSSPPPFLTASCKGFEEVSGDESFLVDCTASTNSGKPIYTNASSNDGYSYVSGINCYSDGGTQACPPTGGTFEFRVNGLNDGSDIVMSSVTVTITSGNLTWTQTYTFKVDPAVGGFLKHRVVSSAVPLAYRRKKFM